MRVISAPEADAVAGRDFEVQGRIDMERLKVILPFDDYDFFMCGPPPFMQALYDGLRGLRVSDAHSHAEAFGPAALVRRPAQATIIEGAVTYLSPPAYQVAPGEALICCALPAASEGEKNARLVLKL